VALTNGKTRETLANDMWQACKILRRDNHCGGVMEYIEHLARADWARKDCPVDDSLPWRIDAQAGLVEHEIHDLINAPLNKKEKTSDHKPVSVRVVTREG